MGSRRNGGLIIQDSPKTRSATNGARTKISGVLVGTLSRLNESGSACVDFAGASEGGVCARSIVALSPQQVGSEVTLMFEDGDSRRPIIMGIIQDARPSTRSIQATMDGETICFEASKEIVLRCGEASITLTRDGKIQLRGTYLLSRSSGVNRIQGGSIELN